MPVYRLQSAYLAQGWARDVQVSVSAQGFITAIDLSAPQATSPQPAARVEPIAGIVVPGMPNAHSHAFQRAMAGNTEYRLSARDSFWTWRQAMYALANRIEPEDLRIVACQLFIEMLKAGYTSVAEFHYLHRQRSGAPYGAENPLWNAIFSAADTAGIGLTFLPTLYQSSDFGGQPLKSEQARFAFDTDEFLKAVAERVSLEARTAPSRVRTGVAFHSLRAVPLDIIKTVTLALRELDATLPVHVHIAEQMLEVRACEQLTGRRPIALLLEQGLVTPHWCLVHATHATPGELQDIAATQATVCLSISTEANLGDGFFDASRFLKSAGRVCVGSDSQASVDPTEELRWLEYQQRLRKRRRGVLASKAEPHVGTKLWRDAALYGAQATGQSVGSIAVGQRADWLVLDPLHPALAGAADAVALDHLLFAGGRAAIRDVMVAGRWMVRDHRHPAEEAVRRDFGALMQRFATA